MQIASITLKNYKRFREPKKFSFTDSTGAVNEKTLIVGNNGTGKSSILQAIVCLIAGAVRDKFTPEKLDWPGFEYRQIQNGNLPLSIEAEIIFAQEELSNIQAYAKRLSDIGFRMKTQPGNLEKITLALDYERRKVFAKEHAAAFQQMRGYQFAKQLAKHTPNKSSLFEKVGNIYWYNEQRNAFNLSFMLEEEKQQLDFIRRFLANAYAYHLDVTRSVNPRPIREGEFDFYAKLETLYRKVFPDRRFEGVAPRFDIYEQASAPDFFLHDGKNGYELASMSAGERAVFPILMDFARWNINHSIIIIDEVELHLHPPLQQALVRVLTQLGENNQFIFTSHSNSVITLFDESENQIIRLGS
ncbi:AAA family ATPase [Rhodoflexus sp.]